MRTLGTATSYRICSGYQILCRKKDRNSHSKNIPSSALNKDFFIFLAWKSIEKYFSTSQKCIQNNFSDQKSIENYFSTSQKFIQNNFSDQKSIEKYFSISQKFIQNNFKRNNCNPAIIEKTICYFFYGSQFEIFPCLLSLYL